MDLRGNGTFSNAPLTHDQDRAVAHGNAGNGALNLRFNRGKRFSLSFNTLDDCTSGHERSWLLHPCISNAGSKPGRQKLELPFHVVYLLLRTP
jgi:hypothetical protein